MDELSYTVGDHQPHLTVGDLFDIFDLQREGNIVDACRIIFDKLGIDPHSVSILDMEKVADDALNAYMNSKGDMDDPLGGQSSDSPNDGGSPSPKPKTPRSPSSSRGASSGRSKPKRQTAPVG